MVLSNDTGGYVVADAIRLVREDTALDEVLVDNSDPDAGWVGGVWALDNNPYFNGWWGANFSVTTAGSGATSFEWTPVLSGPGYYKVHVRWISSPHVPTDARYTIHHAGGEAEFLVNQRTGGSEWQYLGTFWMDPAEVPRISLSDSSADGTWVVADAVRLTPFDETLLPAVAASASQVVAATAGVSPSD